MTTEIDYEKQMAYALHLSNAFMIPEEKISSNTKNKIYGILTHKIRSTKQKNEKIRHVFKMKNVMRELVTRALAKRIAPFIKVGERLDTDIISAP